MLFLKGIAIGVANIIPGVSGATLAVIFRVYDKLLDAINTLFTDMKNSLKFLIPLGLGMVIGIIALGSAMDFFLTRFSLQATAFIAGLMAGSIPFIHKMAIAKDGKKPHFYAIAVVAALIIIALSLFAPTAEIYTGAGFDTALIIRLFLGGVLGAAAMIIPGMSGSIILILLGIFPLAMHTITLIREYLMTPFDFNLLPPILLVIVPVGIGIVVGVLVTSRLIAYLLKKHHSITYFAIMGLIFGTVFAVFNDDATYQSHREITPVLVIFAIIAFAVGIVVSLALGKRE